MNTDLSKSIEDARLHWAQQHFEDRSEQEFDFNSGDWVVCEASFGICLVQVEFSGCFNSVYLRLASNDDFETIHDKTIEK